VKAASSTTHLLDTDTCSYLLRGRVPAVAKRLVELGPTRVAISVVTAIELRTGAEISSSPAKYHRLIDTFLHELAMVPLLATDVTEIGKVRAELRRAGTPIGPLDAMIAGHARARDLVVVTHNVREFSRVAGLTLDDWTAR
jgi:tRNA(fMet)-specific endonuclease VapC